MCIMIGACLPAASHTHNELVFSTGDGLLVQFGVSSSQGGGSSSGFDTGERGHWVNAVGIRICWLLVVNETARVLSPAASKLEDDCDHGRWNALVARERAAGGGGGASAWDAGGGILEFLTEVRSVGKTRPRCGVITDCMDTY